MQCFQILLEMFEQNLKYVVYLIVIAYKLVLLSFYFEIRLKLWRYKKTIHGKINLLTTNPTFIWFVQISLYTSAAWSSPINNIYCYVLGGIGKNDE